jgi:hypothetical protein
MWKNANVVLLPTNEKASNNDLAYRKSDNRLIIPRTFTFNDLQNYYKQHLYILSDEEIKEGDWICNPKQQPHIIKANAGWSNTIDLGYKKIIATTDTDLKIKTKLDTHISIKSSPQIPQSFIEYFVSEYNKGNVIDKVLVEYECTSSYSDIEILNKPYEYKLKINSDNTINIKPIKDSWSREEVIELMKKSIDRGMQLKKDYKLIHKKDHIDKWIEENL